MSLISIFIYILKDSDNLLAVLYPVNPVDSVVWTAYSQVSFLKCKKQRFTVLFDRMTWSSMIDWTPYCAGGKKKNFIHLTEMFSGVFSLVSKHVFPPNCLRVSLMIHSSVCLCASVCVITHSQETVQGSILHVFCDDHDGFACDRRGGFKSEVTSYKKQSLLFAVQQQQQTLTLQYPIDFRFILSGSEQGGP